MRDIEKILETSQSNVKIPPKIEYRVQYTLKNKKHNRKGGLIKRFITVLASLMIVFIGGMSVYAACGGTISGKPVIEWLGIEFSDEYENYVNIVEEQTVANQKTEINLISTMCDEGFTVLEFEVNLSEEDKQYLKIGENVITEEEISQATENGNKSILKSINLKNTIKLIFNNEPQYSNENKVSYSSNNFNIYIDNEKLWIRPRSTQTVTKITDYQYKVYQLYFLTDKELGDKTDFKLTLKNIVIGNEAERSKTTNGMYLTNTENNARYIELDGEFNIELSKKKNLEDCRTIDVEEQESKYKNMTKKIDKVTITPVQTIVKVSTKIEDVSLQSLSMTSHKDYIGINEFKVYDNNGEELSSLRYETKRIITYEDGTVEEWEQGDIGTYMNFENATMELTEYIIIEKRDNITGMKIVPIVRQPVGGTEERIELDCFNINY